jgi:hypothetical protein
MPQPTTLPHASNSIQFNSILYYLCAESTAKRPVTDTAQSRCRYLLYRQTQITGKHWWKEKKVIVIIIITINSTNNNKKVIIIINNNNNG